MDEAVNTIAPIQHGNAHGDDAHADEIQSQTSPPMKNVSRAQSSPQEMEPRTQLHPRTQLLMHASLPPLLPLPAAASLPPLLPLPACLPPLKQVRFNTVPPPIDICISYFAAERSSTPFVWVEPNSLEAVKYRFPVTPRGWVSAISLQTKNRRVSRLRRSFRNRIPSRKLVEFVMWN